MELPLFFLKIINPADVYFRRQAPKSVGPVFRGGAVYGPEGGRQATEEEIRAFDKLAQGSGRSRHDDVAAAMQLYGGRLTAGTAELLAGRPFSFDCIDGRIEARIIRFWRGDSILDVRHQNHQQHGGHGLVRIDRRPQPSKITRYLASAVSELQHP